MNAGVLQAGYNPGYQFSWENGSTDSIRIINQPGNYIATVSNYCYTYSDTATIGNKVCDQLRRSSQRPAAADVRHGHRRAHCCIPLRAFRTRSRKAASGQNPGLSVAQSRFPVPRRPLHPDDRRLGARRAECGARPQARGLPQERFQPR